MTKHAHIENLDELRELMQEVFCTIVVRTAINDLYLLVESEDGDIGYQGFPQEDDEEGTRIDPNTGWVEKWPEIFWPITFVGAADPEEEAEATKRSEALVSAITLELVAASTNFPLPTDVQGFLRMLASEYRALAGEHAVSS